MKHTAQILLSASVISLLPVLPARADPVTVTGGFLLATGVNEVSPPSALTGTDGFTATGQLVIGVGAGRLDAIESCRPFDPFPCGAGASLPLFGFLSAQGSDPGFSDAVVTLRGEEYRDFGIDDPYGFILELEGTAVLPSFGDGAAQSVMAPFTLTGRFFDGMSITQLVGGGMATLGLTQAAFEGVPLWSVEQVRYDMQDTAPIPEPGTLLLVGTGLAGIARARARRRPAARGLTTARRSPGVVLLQ